MNNFVSGDKSPFSGNNFSPYTVSQFSIAFSQPLKNIPFNINVTAVASSKKPPPPFIIRYPDPPWSSRYAVQNNIEADSASFASSKSNSIDLLLGTGYVLPHKEKSRLLVTVNADFGVSLNNDQALNFYFQRRLSGTAPVQKTQMVFNPSVQAKYFFSKSIGLNFIAGYNNRGGINAGVGIAARW